MKDTFDFTSYVRSGRLHEGSYNAPLNPELLQALDPYSHTYVSQGSEDWSKIVAIVKAVFPHFNEQELEDFLVDDYDGGGLGEYAQDLDIRITGIDYEFPDAEPHRTSDTGVEPRGVGEIIKEILTRRLSEIQMGFEYNPKSVTGTGAKRGPKPIAFPYYELKEKFPEHFRLQTKDKEYTMLVSRDVIEAIGQLKDAGRNARSRHLTKLQDELRSLDSPTKRVLIKGTEGQRTFPVMGKEMYILNWPVMGPNKTKEFLWLTPTSKGLQESRVNFQIDENYLD